MSLFTNSVTCHFGVSFHGLIFLFTLGCMYLLLCLPGGNVFPPWSKTLLSILLDVPSTLFPVLGELQGLLPPAVLVVISTPWIVSSYAHPGLDSAEFSKGTLCKSPRSSFCVAFWPVFCPADFCHLGLPALSSIFLNQRDHQALPGFPPFFFCRGLETLSRELNWINYLFPIS